MFGSLGVPELLILLTVAGVYVIPIAAGLWVLLTLRHIRAAQDQIRERLDSLERVVRRGRTA